MTSVSGARKLTDGQLNPAFSIYGLEKTPPPRSMRRLRSSTDELVFDRWLNLCIVGSSSTHKALFLTCCACGLVLMREKNDAIRFELISTRYSQHCDPAPGIRTKLPG